MSSSLRSQQPTPHVRSNWGPIQHVAGFAGAYWERRLNVTTNVATVTNYLSFGGETVALITETSTTPGVITTLWQLKDHLGSTTTLLDASGLLSGTRKSYDVWGKRRHVTGEDDTANSIVSASSRDFTGHEFLEELRLVHMGGRIYDPVVARFLSPDPFVQDPFNLQNLNRYSYVLNNPLAYTDPDGFFFKGLSKLFSIFVSPVSRLIQQIRNPVIRAVALIAISVVVQDYATMLFYASQGVTAASAASTTLSAIGNVTVAQAGAVVSGAAAGFTTGLIASDGDFGAAARGSLGGAISGAFSSWTTTSWGVSDPAALDRVTTADLAQRMTRWDQVALKAVSQAGVSGVLAAASGQKAVPAFLYALGTSSATELYRSFVPWDAQGFGSEREGREQAFIKEGSSAEVVIARDGTNWGTWRVPNAPAGLLTEGNTISRVMSRYVPGMEATAKVHDVWAVIGRGSVCESSACATTMLPAFGLAYGSLMRNIDLESARASSRRKEKK